MKKIAVATLVFSDPVPLLFLEDQEVARRQRDRDEAYLKELREHAAEHMHHQRVIESNQGRGIALPLDTQKWLDDQAAEHKRNWAALHAKVKRRREMYAKVQHDQEIEELSAELTGDESPKAVRDRLNNEIDARIVRLSRVLRIDD